MPASGFHHVEVWVRDLAKVQGPWSGFWTSSAGSPTSTGPRAAAGTIGAAYLVVEQSSALRPGLPYDRMRPGLNHLAVHAPDRRDRRPPPRHAPEHGWSRMFADAYPHAGGAEHYAAYLEDESGFEFEIVAPE